MKTTSLEPGDKFGIVGCNFTRVVKHVWPKESHNECDIVQDTTGAQWGASVCYPYREAMRSPKGDWGSAQPDVTEAFTLPPLTELQEAIVDTCDQLSNLLLAKNRSYGNSATDPIRVFSKVSADEGLLLRIDDKLSRIARGHEYDEEDTLKDLAGYCILLLAKRKVEK